MAEFFIFTAETETTMSSLKVLNGAESVLCPTASEVSITLESPSIRQMGKHHSTDDSVTGGGVILGGFITAIVAAVVCYIQFTRK